MQKRLHFRFARHSTPTDKLTAAHHSCCKRFDDEHFYVNGDDLMENKRACRCFRDLLECGFSALLIDKSSDKNHVLLIDKSFSNKDEVVKQVSFQIIE